MSRTERHFANGAPWQLGLAALVACGLAASVARAGPTAAQHLTVNCPSDPSTFASINSAIGAASPGGTITVCPGFYPENVVVTVDRLTIQALHYGTAKIVPGDPNSPGIQLNANCDTIRGFAISGFSDGIYTGSPYGQEKIEDNTIIGNNEGIGFNDSMDNYVKHNTILANADNGILDFYGIVIIINSANQYVNNDVEYNKTNGIFINTDAPLCTYERAEVVNNVLDNNGADGLRVNVSGYVKVLRNKLQFNGEDGLELFGSWNNDFSENRAEFNGASQTICGPSMGSGNCVGYRVHSDSVANRFDDNSAVGNLVWDAQDNSSGPGTAGTANRWHDDKCVTDSPDGLCHHL